MAEGCRHCGWLKVSRPRGLCWTCYYAGGVREKYPSTSKYARRGVGNGGHGLTDPEPTTATPGSPEKVVVLGIRAANGQRLWHPDDPRV